MTRVIARCPNCGVERDDAVGGPCDVCGTELRFWCRLHGKEVGWLDTPECPACAAELTARHTPPPAPEPPRAPVPPRERVPPREPAPRREPSPPRRRRTRVPAEPTYPPAYEGRPAGEVLRESAEDLRPYVATGATLAFRLIRAFFALLRYAIAGAVVGGLIGAGTAYNQRGDLVWPVISGAIIGGGIGVLIGAIVAIRILFAESPRRVR